MASSLAKRLKGGKPEQGHEPDAEDAAESGAPGQQGPDPVDLARALGRHDLAGGEEQDALGQAVAEDVQQDGGDGERDAGGRAEGDEPHVLDAVVREHALVVALGEQQRRGHGQREQGHDHEQRAGEPRPDGSGHRSP